jgi:transcriptional antiterminator NusG
MTTDTMADTPWYAIQSYSGHENKVQKLIQRRIEEEPGEIEERHIREVLVPTPEVG